jgi:hypothetical protein
MVVICGIMRRAMAEIPARISCNLHHPRRAASIVAMSILPISIIAAKSRLASAPLAARAFRAAVAGRGVYAQPSPPRSNPV